MHEDHAAVFMKGFIGPVLGKVSESQSLIAIYQLHPWGLRDQFQCMQPAISPDHRWIAFQMWYPRIIPYPYIISDQYLIYDVGHNPDFNRPQQAKINSFNAGIRIYPPGPRKVQALSNVVNRNRVAENHSMVSHGFDWLSDHQVAFADTDHIRTDLIIVQVHNNGTAVIKKVLCLSCDRLINTQKCPGQPATAFMVKNIRRSYRSRKTIRISLWSYRPGCLRHRSLILRMQK